MKGIFQYLLLFSSLVSVDQFSKYIFIEKSVCNKNLAWGIPIAPGVFYLFWTIIVIFLFFAFFESHTHFRKFLIIIILSGAMSNMLDRIIRNCVIDFINLKIWPIFNVADIYITIGIIMLSIIQILNPKH